MHKNTPLMIFTAAMTMIPHASFGELRALLHTPHDAAALAMLERAHHDDNLSALISPDSELEQAQTQLLTLLQAAHALDPATYQEQWMPYLDGKPLPIYAFELNAAEVKALIPARATCSLNLNFTRLEAGALAAHLAAAPALWGLELSNTQLSDADLELIATDAPLAQTLRSLDLSGNTISAKGWRTLTDAQELRLEHLYLDGANLSAAQLKRLLYAPALAQLKTLSLAEIQLNAPALQALATWPGLAQLQRLSLNNTKLTDKNAQPLLSAPQLSSLHHLTLNNNPKLGPTSAQRIAQNEALLALKQLAISNTNIQSAGLAALLSSPNLPKLELLFAAECRCADDALAHISARELRSLDLSLNDLTARGVAALASAPIAQTLRHLSLRANQLEPQATRGLGALTQLEILDLSDNALLDEGVLTLANTALQLKTLSLEQTQTSDAGARALSCSPHLSQLHTLILSDNVLSARGLDALLSSAHLHKLTLLRLAGCAISFDDPEDALTPAPHLKSALRGLNLINNRLGPRGAQALAQLPQLSALEGLSLNNNNLQDEGAQALASAAALASLQWIGLWHNNISAQGIDALNSSPYLSGAMQNTRPKLIP